MSKFFAKIFNISTSIFLQPESYRSGLRYCMPFFSRTFFFRC